jgi:hypothetical protein
LALTALIAAYHESAEAGALRATLPLAGRTVVERQARLAAAAGATRIVVLVERMPQALSVALERLRRERVPLQVARSVEEAAESVDPSDRLLLIADGAIAEPSQLERLARAEGAVVLTVPDAAYGELYERIDAASRWAGLAAVEGSMLRDTAAMLRDWDLQSTLLRRTLQSGARHLPTEGPVAILDSRADLALLERRILASAAEARGGWAERLLGPVERAATQALMGGPVGPRAIGTAAAVLTALGALAFLYGWFWTGLVKLLIATPLDGIAARLARLRMQDDIGRSWWSLLLPVLSGAALVSLAYALAPIHGWGMLLLAITTLAFLIALGIETDGRRLKGDLFFADRKAMAWLLLPFAVFDAWQAGLAGLFAYAAGSFFWAQHQAHAAMPPRQD